MHGMTIGGVRTKRLTLTIALALCALVAAVGVPAAAHAQAQVEGNPGGPGTVWAMTNETAGNRVLTYARDADGTLTERGSFSTGGKGSGGFEGSSNGLILGEQSPANLGNRGNHLLFATNTGSGDVSVFRVRPDDTLELVDRESSGGLEPISITVHGNIAYVLNNASGNIQGFEFGGKGDLTPIPGSSRPVTGGGTADVAQVAFTPGGDQLIVTGKNTNVIDTYQVGRGGAVTAGPIPNRANGITPFGMAFTQRGQLLTTEGHLTTQGLGAVSSYEVGKDGVLKTISGSVRNFRSDTCWIVNTDDGKLAYVTNVTSGDISSYRVNPDGTLVLLQSVAADTGGLFPIDEALSGNSKYLYARTLNAPTGAPGTIRAYRVERDGTLTLLQTVPGLPPGAIGLAAK